jgi:hypothetical protein
MGFGGQPILIGAPMTNKALKLPSAYSDRGYAFPLKIKGGTDRY